MNLNFPAKMTITATSDGHFVGKIVSRACRLGSAYNVLDEKGEVAFSIRREAGCCGCGCGCCCGSDSDMIRKFLVDLRPLTFDNDK